MPKYSVSDFGTNTAGDTMLYFVNVAGATASRLSLYELVIGSDATPADQAGDYRIHRITNEHATPGGGAITPSPLDVASRVALAEAVGFTITGEPTGTEVMLAVSLNQRATFRWVAAPGSEFVCDNAEDNGFSIFPSSVTSAFAVAISMMFDE